MIAPSVLYRLKSSPRWVETDLSSLPLTFAGTVVAVRAVTGAGVLTVTDGTGATAQPLTLANGILEPVELLAITATDAGVTLLRVYLADPASE